MNAHPGLLLRDRMMKQQKKTPPGWKNYLFYLKKHDAVTVCTGICRKRGFLFSHGKVCHENATGSSAKALSQEHTTDVHNTTG